MIKMILKGRSPHMRHFSRRHRDDFDLALLERINVDSDISLRHVCTNQEIADVPTKGSLALALFRNLCSAAVFQSLQKMFRLLHRCPKKVAIRGTKIAQLREVQQKQLQSAVVMFKKGLINALPSTNRDPTHPVLCCERCQELGGNKI